jgi:hypothetical protein
MSDARRRFAARAAVETLVRAGTERVNVSSAWRFAVAA